MSYTININKTPEGINEIALTGELSLKNADALKTELINLAGMDTGFSFNIENIQALDITFIQLLIAFKSKALSESKSVLINWNLNEDLINLLEGADLSE